MATYTSITGNNGDLIKVVAGLYLVDNMRIADVTYGKGVFWRQVDLKRFKFCPSDIKTCKDKYDFRDLPYRSRSFDCVVLDPPYCHNPGSLIVDANYRNAETTKGMYHDDIIQLYRDGMIEACRILKEGGMLWVKCKDEVESGYQRWSHIELYLIAIELGLYAKDLFVLTPSNKPVIQRKNQKHARKNHSYLFVFMKPRPSEIRTLTRFQIFKKANGDSQE